MAKLKEGGIALIVKGEGSGLSVITEYRLSPGESKTLDSPDGRYEFTLNNTANEDAWIVSNNRLMMVIRGNTIDCIAIKKSSELMPIDGGIFDVEKVREKEKM